jgi:4-methyl-5(b-hydroxyethyl)-thiazole monophosphate biosynthesis
MEEKDMEQSIAVFLADGFEEIEGLTVVDLCRRAGITVHTVSITGSLTITGSHGIVLQADQLMEETDFTDLDMVVLPGGLRGTNALKAHDGVKQKVQEFLDDGKYIAAICAAPTVFGAMGILNGKKAICYPGMEGDLTGAEVTTEPVVQDGKIITSRGLGTAIDFALKIIENLKNLEKADEIAKSVVYR